MIGTGLAWLGRHATSVMFASVFAGLALPALAAALKPLFALVAFLLLVVTMVRLDWDAIPAYLRRPLVPATSVLALLLASPVLMAGLVGLMPLPASLATALVLMMAAPPLMSAPAIALLVGLEAPFALLVTVAATFLVPLTLPFLALSLLGLDLQIGAAALSLRLLAFVGGAVAIAVLIKRLAGATRLARAAPRLDGVSVLLLLVFAIAIMDGVTAAFLTRPGHVLMFAAAAFAANLGAQLVAGGTAALVTRGGRKLTAFTIALMAGNRNLGMLLAVMIDTAHPDFHLFVAVGQFPIYMLPALALPIYRRVLGR